MGTRRLTGSDTVFQVQEVHIDRTDNVEVGRTEWDESDTTDIGELYKNWQAEYGRCTGKIYQDSKDGKSYHVGYVFQARIPYGSDCMKSNRVNWPKRKPGETCRPGHHERDCGCTYLCEMWCSWRTLKRDPNAAAPGLAYLPLATQYEEA